MLEQKDFRKLLASLFGATVHEVKLFEESQGLIRMMQASRCLQDDGLAHVREFVQHCYQPNSGDLPLEHYDWDLLLFSKLAEALELDTEVASDKCMSCMYHSMKLMMFCACLGVSSVDLGVLRGLTNLLTM